MFKLHRADERQHVQVLVQETWRTFPWPDPAQTSARGEGVSAQRMAGFGILESLDESRLSPGAEVALQPDPEAETITYVLKGALAQDDAMGHTKVIGMGEVQRMTLDRNTRCYERNASRTDWVHFLRMSLHPAASQEDNTHEQRFFSVAQRRGRLCIVGSPDGRRQSLRLFQDSVILSAVLTGAPPDPQAHAGSHGLGPCRLREGHHGRARRDHRRWRGPRWPTRGLHHRAGGDRDPAVGSRASLMGARMPREGVDGGDSMT